MISIKFNKKNLIPNIRDYIKILVSVFLLFYVVLPILYLIFPWFETLNTFWYLVFFVTTTTWIRDIIIVNYKGHDYL